MLQRFSKSGTLLLSPLILKIKAVLNICTTKVWANCDANNEAHVAYLRDMHDKAVLLQSNPLRTFNGLLNIVCCHYAMLAV